MPVIPAVELVSTIAPPAPRSIIDGMAVSTVLNTPVRLTSMTSCQALCSSVQPHRGDAGVGQHDVDRAELGHAPLERLPELGFVAHVGLRGEDAPVERLDLP